MVFSSMVFLWIFLPIVVVGNFLLRKTKIQNLFLLAASLLFYAWGEPKYVVFLLISIAVNWLAGLGMEKYPTQKKRILFLDILFNIGFLGYFKYANFVLNTIDHALPFVRLPRIQVIMPIGISFFTFQAMTYVIDYYRGKYEVQKNPLHLALYISFFPQLIAGPIVKYREVNEQILCREVNREKVAEGIRRFAYGLGKKVILANTLAVTADRVFAMPGQDLTAGIAWMGALLYTLQIYYDFSGYSDMAIGMGKMFGFTFLENFDLPYLSRSVNEFWRRWHISLGSWFREYLYIPLGGNRKGKARTYINLFIVFALTGLWHGASWNFVGWGIFHGFFVIAERMGFSKALRRAKGINWVYTFLVALIGWIFFRVEALSDGIHMVKVMFSPWAHRTTLTQFRLLVSSQTLVFTIFGVLGAGFLQAVFSLPAFAGVKRRWIFSFVEAGYLLLVVLYCIVLLANNVYNPFIYYRF